MLDEMDRELELMWNEVRKSAGEASNIFEDLWRELAAEAQGLERAAFVVYPWIGQEDVTEALWEFTEDYEGDVYFITDEETVADAERLVEEEIYEVAEIYDVLEFTGKNYEGVLENVSRKYPGKEFYEIKDISNSGEAPGLREWSRSYWEKGSETRDEDERFI